MPRKKSPKLKTDRLEMEERVAAAKVNRERILIRLVTSIARACTMHATRSTSQLGISLSQAIVLGELFTHNGCRQEDLRSYVALDKGNVTRALQRLEEYGLVQRQQDPVDRRVTRVYVTRKALGIEVEMYKLGTLWDDRLTAGFTPEERETLTTLLLRVEVNARAMAKDDEIGLDGTYS